MRDPIRHLKALAFAVTVFLITSFALAQVNPQLFPFMPYVWPYVTGGSLTYAGTDLEIAPAAPFALQDQRGATVSLADQQGKVVLLTFLDPSCTDDCLLMAQEIATALERLEADAHEVVVLAVNVNPDEQTPAAMLDFLKTQGLTKTQPGTFSEVIGKRWQKSSPRIMCQRASRNQVKRAR